MKQEDNMEMQVWSEIECAYSAHKELFIQAEERLNEMKLFPAPVLEQRDALDHIMQYVAIKAQKGDCDEAVEQLKNAKQHVLRAYFDTADYVCITVRAEIARELNKLSARKIKSVWTDYTDVRAKIQTISQRIAEVRYARTESLDQISQYKGILSDVFDLYDRFQREIYPRIKMGFLKWPWQKHK